MGFPSANTHRRNRRHLGRGQGPFPAAVGVTATGSGSTVILTFAVPVVVTGNIPVAVAGLTFVSQAINSPTQVTVTMSGAVATKVWSLAAGVPQVASYQGGLTLGASGTF